MARTHHCLLAAFATLPQKLRALHEVAEKHGDSQMCDFVGERRVHSLAVVPYKWC